MYEVLLESHARRDLKGLPGDLFRRVISEIQALGKEPRPAGCCKIHGSRSDWRIRVGDHRVLYEIDDRARQVRVLRVRHRREAYR